jgi:hypothetical protein
MNSTRRYTISLKANPRKEMLTQSQRSMSIARKEHLARGSISQANRIEIEETYNSLAQKKELKQQKRIVAHTLHAIHQLKTLKIIKTFRLSILEI